MPRVAGGDYILSVKINPLSVNQINPEEFDRRLLQETQLLKNWFDDAVFVEEELEAGSETEFFILNQHYDLEPQNIALVNKLSCPQLVTECGAAQLEINSSHHPLTLNCLTQLHQNILKIWKKAENIAHHSNCHLALIGSLPTANNFYNTNSYLTNSKRYQLMSERVATYRRGENFSMILEGREQLTLDNPLAMCLGGLISSFQLHLKVPLSQSVKYYNITQAISAPMLALCANSPYFSGQDVWSETRICLYEQLFLMKRHVRYSDHVDSFGDNYLSHSLFELFEQNLKHYPRLLTEISPDLPIEQMFHVRRLNGTIYRWNRPVIDFCNHQAHLRIEHRGPSTGPTVTDMISNAAFFYGIVHYFASEAIPIEQLLIFQHAKHNFYQAARHGLDAQLTWFSGRQVYVCDLLQELLPLARKGLLRLNMAIEDIDYYLHIIQQRLCLKQNGASWQRAFVGKYGKDFPNMLKAYVQNQNEDIPVSNWKI